MCKVSVIIPTYNREKLLPRALDSVLNQTFKDFEVIVVDDCSTDGTSSLIKQYADTRIRYIRQEQNGGAAAARNSGIEAARGEYIAFQDSDDEWYPEKLEKQMALMEASAENVGIVFCRYLYINESENLRGVCPAENITGQDIIFSNLLVKNHIGAPTMLVRKSCLCDVGGFDSSLRCLEDYDLVLKLTEKYQVLMVDEVLVTAYGEEGGVSSNVLNYFNSRLELYQRYKQSLFYYGLIDVVKKELITRAYDCGLGDAVSEKLEAIINERPEYKKKVSVIIPCYNSVKYLPECLASLERQTIGIENLEIVLVNDASTDNTYEMLLGFEKKYPESVMVINLPENIRQGGARNVGISYASGEYLAFLDSDDAVTDNAYERLYSVAKKYDVDILQYNNNSTPMVKEAALYHIETAGERRVLVSGGILTFGCTNKFYRLDFVKSVGSRFAEHMIFEEPPFVYPLFFYLKKIFMLPEELYLVRVHSESSMSGTAKKKNRILEHPEAQMLVLKDLINRKWIFDEFYKEVSAYFIWSYYVETIIIAGQSGLAVDAAYFSNMQKTVRAIFPDYMENDLICFEGSGYFPALDSLNKSYNQKQLDEFCRMCAIKNEEASVDITVQSANTETILFLDWPCFMKESTIAAMKRLGYDVSFFFHKDYQQQESNEFVSKFESAIKIKRPDLCFSYNYYPIFARCCYDNDIPYISVVYDSPYLFIYSKTVGYPTNHIYLFDRSWVSELNNMGFSNVHYTVLPGDPDKIDRIAEDAHDGARAECDISFVGSLYNEHNNYYDQLYNNAEPYLQGFLKGIINSQKKIYGASIIEDMISGDILRKLKKAYPLESDPSSMEPEFYRYSDYIIKKQITGEERRSLIGLAGDLANKEGYTFKLFTENEKTSIPGVQNMGIAPYDSEMNRVFKESKINLNITLRSIKTGIPLRCIDIMSSGGFLLSNYQSDLCEDFIPGEDFEYYGDETEMLEKIRFYMVNDSERIRIANNGRKKIRDSFSFDIIFGNILKQI